MCSGACRGQLSVAVTAWHRHLALSTNNIEKISSLSGMDSLRILSLGRNLIKKIENLDAVADTLEELWISYNQVTSLVRSGSVGCMWTASSTHSRSLYPLFFTLLVRVIRQPWGIEPQHVSRAWATSLPQPTVLSLTLTLTVDTLVCVAGRH